MSSHRWMQILILACVVAKVPVAARGAATEMPDLAVADVLAAPGEKVTLVAKLEKRGSKGTNIPGASVEFRLDGTSIGAGKTDDRGVAKLEIDAPARGDHTVKAVFEGSPEWMRAEYNALLAVRAPDEAILAVDIDWTLAMTDNLNTSQGGADCPPLAGAPEALDRLAKKYTIVYVTNRARQLRKRTISWLIRYGFPRGPSIYLDPSDYPTYDVVQYKTAVFQDLVKRFPGLEQTIGNDPDDLAAAKAAGLPAHLLVDTPQPGATTAPTWAELEKAMDTPPPSPAGNNK